MSRKIKLDPNNFNLHTKGGMELLEKSIKEVGAIESVTLDKNGEVVTGNARQQTFEKLGYKPKFIRLEQNEYPVIETDLEGEKRVKAALLANTVAKHNIRLDEEKIQEVAVEEYGIEVQELGVMPEQEEEQGGPLGIYPLSIILNAKEYKDFQLYKKENGIRTDTEAFKQLFVFKTLE